jgi:hypothetical protein
LNYLDIYDNYDHLCFLVVKKHYFKKSDYLSPREKLIIVRIILNYYFMKNGILILVLIIFSLPVLIAQNNHNKKNPVGMWKFEAPYAPEGYTSGTIVVGFTEQKPTSTMSFSGNELKFPGENVKTEKDSVFFSVYIQGEDVKVMLKIENDTTMSGKAVYSEGEVPLSLTKAVASDAVVKQ